MRVRSNQTHGYLRKSSHCVLGTFVPRTSGPLLDAEIKVCLITALSVRHPSVFMTQQTHVLSVNCAYATHNFSIHLTYTCDVRGAYASRTYGTFFVLLPSVDASVVRYTYVLFTLDIRHSHVTRTSKVSGTYAV
jgi:hypothetical protein